MPASPVIENTGATDTKQKSKIQKGWSNAPSREDLYNDFSVAESGQDAYRTKLLGWQETIDGGKAIKSVRLGKSTARPLLARKSAEWKYPALSEPILSTKDMFKVSPIGGEDVASAKQNAMILNNQWATKVGKTSLVDSIVRNLVDEGTAIVKTGWDSEYGIKEVEKEVPVYASPEESLAIIQQSVQSGEMAPEQAQAMLEMGEPVQTGTKIIYENEETLAKNQPSYEVCINANVTIDPTCLGNIADAKFVVHSYDTSWAELKSDEFGVDEDGEEYGIYHNIDNLWDGDEGTYDPFKSDDANNFSFSDEARKELRAYEYWGYWDIQGDGELVAIVATWVGKTLIRLEENPFPHGRIPFSVCSYMPVKWSVHGEPDAELLKENQEAIGKMTRAIHDITARQAVGQEFIDENFFPSPSQKNAYEKGNTVFYRSGFNPSQAIHKMQVQDVGRAPFDVISWQQQDAAELTGTRPSAPGGQGSGKLGATSGQKDAMDATAKRELSILRRMADMFIDMARMTIAMNQQFLSEKETIRITGDKFVTIKRDDLEGRFDLKVEISTPEKDEDQATKIMTLMQTNAANTDPEIVKMHYVKMAELWKLPDLAEKVEAYQPQPDPQQQELLALQIEEQKLKNAKIQKELEDMDSKIFERLSRTEENQEADIAMKQAKAEQAMAAAEKLREEADALAQKFVDDSTGVTRQRELEDRQLDEEMKDSDKTRDVKAEMIKSMHTSSLLNEGGK